MTKLSNLKKSKKGFTLVEVIVVLVIIAILIAIAVPSLTGYITKAKNQANVADARTILMAAQTLASEKFKDGSGNLSITDITDADVKGLTGTGITGSMTALTVVGGRVTAMTYEPTSGSPVTYDGTKFN